VKHDDAVALIRAAVEGRSGTWADLGAGTGTFTRALGALLGEDSVIYAVDKDRGSIEALKALAHDAKNIIPVYADFTQSFEIGSVQNRLDGMLLANALHFVKDAEEVLTRLVSTLRPGGRVVIVEYDRRKASRWVPYPIPRERLPALASAAGLSEPVVTATKPSDYQGILYVARADRIS
jgi:ubiquinone/menaquinone biosynthesis C-methylase UbiE